MTRILLGWPAFWVVALAAQAWNVASESRVDPYGYLFGDSNFYAAAADSLLRDGDLDLFNQCFAGRGSIAEVMPELEGTPGGEYGWATGGYLTLKQSPVLAAAAVPFYAVLGKPGCLLFNLIVLNLLLVGMVKLAGGSPAARAVVLLGFLSTPLWRYAFNFSPDVFLCALLVGSVWAARDQRPVLAGVLAGLAVSTKVYVVLFALPVTVVVWFVAGRRLLALFWLASGGVVGVLPGLLFNTWLFGAPWVTGYERQLNVENGVIGLATHTSLFRVPPLTGLQNLILDDRLGLLWTAPVWFAWPIAASIVLTRRFAPPSGRAWVVAAIGVILANLALFAPYAGWDATRVGNRYLFPAIVFGVAVIGAAVNSLTRKSAPSSPG